MASRADQRDLAGATWLFSEPQTHLRRLGVVAGGGMVAIIALAMP